MADERDRCAEARCVGENRAGVSCKALGSESRQEVGLGRVVEQTVRAAVADLDGVGHEVATSHPAAQGSVGGAGLQGNDAVAETAEFKTLCGAVLVGLEADDRVVARRAEQLLAP